MQIDVVYFQYFCSHEEFIKLDMYIQHLVIYIKIEFFRD